MYKLEVVPSKHQLFDIELVQFIGCLNLFSGAGLHRRHGHMERDEGLPTLTHMA